MSYNFFTFQNTLIFLTTDASQSVLNAVLCKGPIIKDLPVHMRQELWVILIIIQLLKNNLSHCLGY